ncbi:disulfide isomerase [Grosmannia clavigera kw1407]|uniref:protein disulfide-isomerase n=1 Tax=Grosmannia clavigera (strain kw1407 / UAMH 11150) TaxID=655863 RepID=F0XCT2_GROCL|nr:disulfide isomerase [Grosmannia clavigera kw1407]EFX03608.1 disulfide isomerase [Grosmannia clavigera kw1407]
MHSSASLSAVAIALLSVLPAAQAGLYTKSSPVLQVNAKNYDQLVAKSNHTTILEFYAPWCGHCQNLKPAYEKAARSLDGLAHVAAIDCDDDANKQFCGMNGVQGFPTLKIVRPGKKTGRPVMEDYQGPRTATGIVDAVTAKINNHVIKVTDADVDAFLDSSNGKPKALLFTKKGTTSPLLKSLAIDFLDVIALGQVRDKEAKTVEKFGVASFPTLVLVPGGDAEPIKYDGELKKDAMVKFLSQAGAPNPDRTPSTASSKAKKESQSKTKAAREKKEKATKESSETETETATTTKAEQTAPVIVESAMPIPTINTPEKLAKECLHGKAHACVLAFVPASHGGNTAIDNSKVVLEELSELAFKHAQSKRNLFPFFAVPDSNTGAADLLKALGLASDNVQLVAINARRGWWRHYEAVDFSREGIESWIDAIRLGEGAKKQLPEGIVAVALEDGGSTTEPEQTAPELTVEAAEPAADEPKHDEL